MLGLIFAALYVAFAIVVNDTPPIVAVESTLGFLWYWHVTWTCVIGVFLLILPLGGTLLAVAGNGKEKAAGAALILGSPLLVAFGLLIPALFLGAVYALDSGIQGGEIVNQNHVIVGGVLYGVAILSRIGYKSSTKS